MAIISNKKFEREKEKINPAVTELELKVDNEQSMINGIEKFIRKKVKIVAQVKSAYQVNNKKMIIADKRQIHANSNE